ncbi:hypothetical protein H634G_11114 [Metarhizium anisopliae BRIP 53293]|uniref:Methyltransferase domain-containing protein n=1 Tax=Metarhizium anisopliae BRIP 53293 TaxID=1291518 RepID=A0A0D9NLY3_METAN|nr:hypothetical protein H634G_11114 [Metarhizium anisopliae BRIP 53293]
MGIQKKVKKAPFQITNIVQRILFAASTQSLSHGPSETKSSSHHVITSYSDKAFVMTDGNATVVEGDPAMRSPDDYSILDDGPYMPQINGPPIREDDEDSTYGEAPPTTTTSMCSAAARCITKHGRRYEFYYQGGFHPFPNDAAEQQRLAAFHRHITHVLDMGTGTGDWAIDMGKLYRGAVIIGTDLSPIQRRKEVSIDARSILSYDKVPVNVEWIMDDLELEWVDPILYHYIHCRNFGGSIKDWPRLIRQVHEGLEPGGWVEFHELSTDFTSDDETIGLNTGLAKLISVLNEACKKTGRILDPTPRLKDWIVEAGFSSVQQHNIKLPVGDWPENRQDKDIGVGVREYISDGLQGMTAVLVREELGWSEDKVEELCAQARATMSLHARLSIDYTIVIAQKAPRDYPAA